MKILIADDSRLMRDRIRETVSIFNSVEIVGETDNGDDTLEKLNTCKPDLAIIDIRMPDKNGLEVLKEYRKNNKNTKVMILTNYAYEQYRERALKNGADYFFSKSEDFDKIAAVVAALLRNGNGKNLNPYN